MKTGSEPTRPIPLIGGTSVPGGALPWLQVAIRSDIGRVREENEDSVFGLTALVPAPGGGAALPFGFFAVADGMGGLAEGGAASHQAIATISEHIVTEVLLPALAGRQAERAMAEVLAAAMQAANRLIFEASQVAGAASGTTFSGVLVLGGQLVIGHAGDSRIYLAGPEGLVQLTEDHSLVGRLVAMGQLTAEEAQHNPQRNALYRAIGQAEVLDLQTTGRRWAGARRLLLCSDGLWDVVGDRELESVLTDAADADHVAAALIQLANARGGPDNISAIVVDFPVGAA